MGKIKKLHFNEIVGWAQEGTTELYPITSTMAVFDENNECLDDILKNIKGGTTSARALKIYSTVSSRPETPSNSVYDYATGMLSNIESGWEDIRYAPLDQAIWVSDGVAIKGTNQIEWGTPYKFGGSNKGKLVRVYKKSALKPETPVGGSYIWSSDVLTPPSGWSKDYDLNSLVAGEYIWFSDKLFLMDNDDNPWSDPQKMIFYKPEESDTPEIGKPEVSENVQVTVYAKSRDGAEALWQNYCLNSNGEGLGTFDFDTKKVTFDAPLDTIWYQNIDNVIDENHTPIYSSTKNFYTNDLTRPWSSPIRYILPGDIIQSSASNSVSFGVAIYKAVTDNTIPSKPQFSVALDQQFDFNKGQLVENAIKAIGWQLTPELAAQQITNSKYVIYVSYNNYICDRDSEGNIKEDTIRETGWTDPIKYLNIDKILQNVKQEAQDAANEAIQNASNDLTAANGALTQAKADIEQAKTDIANAKQFLGDGYTAFINGTGSNLTAITAQLATKDELTGYVTTSTFEQTANSIKQQVSNEYAQENEQLIRTAVGEITSDYIRQQVTEVIGNDVVTTAQLEIKSDEIKSQIASDINNSTSVIGQKIDQVRIAASNQAVDDLTNKINTGEITVKPGNISLVVATGTTEAESKAVFNLSIKDGESQTNITSDTIALNGETIADAIAAKYLNIDNTTYLFGKFGTTGSYSQAINDNKLPSTETSHTNTSTKYPIALFGAGTPGTTKFNSDGSGWLAGGLVKWGAGVGTNNSSSNFGLSVSGHIEARSGYIGTYNNKAAWEIGTLTEGSTTYPALLGYSSDVNNRLILSTEFLESKTGEYQNWRLQKDGSGQLGRGNIEWKLSGSNICNLSIKGNTYIEAAYIGSGSNKNNLLWLGTQNSAAFISASNEGNGNGILFTTNYLTAGAATRDTNGYLTFSTKGWQLNADGSGQLGANSITWNAEDGLQVVGNITATDLTLGDNGATMEFATYTSTVHGAANNGFSYIDEGEPILFGQYGNASYCIPLLKMGGAYQGSISYQECKVYEITNEDSTAANIYSLISSDTNVRTLYRVKEGNSPYSYKSNNIKGPVVTGIYISYTHQAPPRAIHRYQSSSAFSPPIYTGEDSSYLIRVFDIQEGTIVKAYETYITKKIYISIGGDVAAGTPITYYNVSNEWEFANSGAPRNAPIDTSGGIFWASNGSNAKLTIMSHVPLQQVVTFDTVPQQTISGAYNEAINSISTDSTPFNMASGGLGSSELSTNLITSLTPQGTSNRAYSCSAFNQLLYTGSVVKESYTTNTIKIEGKQYLIEICDEEPTEKLDNVIYLIKSI